MDRTRQYNAALMEIKSNIQSNPTYLEDIKFCCGNIDGFTASELESIENVTHLYKKLQQLDMLGVDNTSFLKQLLQSVHLEACVKILERYENGGVQPRQQPHSQSHSGHGDAAHHDPQPIMRQSSGHIMQPEPSEDLGEAFDLVVENIGRDWRRLARRLPGKKVTETEIEEITDRHSRDLREQSRGALVLWQQKNPQHANKSVLVDVLRQCDMNFIADLVDGWQLR